VECMVGLVALVAVRRTCMSHLKLVESFEVFIGQQGAGPSRELGFDSQAQPVDVTKLLGVERATIALFARRVTTRP